MKTVWEDIPANSREARRLTAQAAAAGAGLIVFPEFTFTGFTKTPTRFADTPDHPRQLACAEALTREYPLAVACGRIVASEPLPRNNLTLIHQGRTLLSYDKLHSYSFGGETAVYGRGDRIMTTRARSFVTICVSRKSSRWPRGARMFCSSSAIGRETALRTGTPFCAHARSKRNATSWASIVRVKAAALFMRPAPWFTVPRATASHRNRRMKFSIARSRRKTSAPSVPPSRSVPTAAKISTQRLGLTYEKAPPPHLRKIAKCPTSPIRMK